MKETLPTCKTEANNVVQLTRTIPQVVIHLTADSLLPAIALGSRAKSVWMGRELCDRTPHHP